MYKEFSIFQEPKMIYKFTLNVTWTWVENITGKKYYGTSKNMEIVMD